MLKFTANVICYCTLSARLQNRCKLCTSKCWHIVFLTTERVLNVRLPACTTTASMSYMSCCYFALAATSFIKSGTPYIWMQGDLEYMVSIWLRRPLTKGASKAEWQSKLCGFMLHKADPEGPTSSWNFKQCGARTAVTLLLEHWRDGSFFRSLTYSL